MHDLPILRGTTVYLGPMPDDTRFFQDYSNWLSTDRVRFGIDDSQSDAKTVRAMIQEWRDDPTNMTFCIFDAETNGWIGDVCLRYGYEEYELEGPETAIMVGTSFGKGKGYEAMTLLLDYGFNTLHHERINLSVYTDNTPAVRLYRKLGFETVATGTDATNGREEYVMTLTRERWNSPSTPR